MIPAAGPLRGYLDFSIEPIRTSHEVAIILHLFIFILYSLRLIHMKFIINIIIFISPMDRLFKAFAPKLKNITDATKQIANQTKEFAIGLNK